MSYARATRAGQPGYIAPGSAGHSQLITPSKVAAILGVSRWESAYRLWHRMKGLLAPEGPKDIFDLGHDFEPAMAAIWKRRNPGWQLSPGEVQYVIDPKWFGYPAAVTLDRRARRGRTRRVVEFKMARRLEEWGDQFTDAAPADYVAQVITQMAYTGFTDHPAELVVLGPFFEAHTYVIPFDADIADAIHDQCRAFWSSLQGDEPPPLDDSVATYEAVRALHPDINGATVQVDPDMALHLLLRDRESKANERALREVKTRFLNAMGNAQTAMCGDIKVADRRPHARGGVALALATKNIDQLANQVDGITA